MSNAEARIGAAMNYAAAGLKVLPLRGRGKVPWVTNWQVEASDDEEKIVAWWTGRPQSNVGVQLGPRSGIVDFEGDEEKSEEDLRRLFGGEIPVCPTFTANRGKHRIFQFRPDLPSIAVVHIGAVELRIGGDNKGAQTVFPPSTHPSGKLYEWLPGLSLDEVDPPPISDAVLAKIWNLRGESPGNESPGRSPDEWQRLAQGVCEGERNGTAASVVGRWLAQQVDVFEPASVALTWEMIAAWNQRNRPPLDEAELRRTFESVLKRERTKRQNTQGGTPRHPVRRDEAGVAHVEGWRLVIVESEPSEYRLFGPLWDGFVSLSAKQMHQPGAIATAALEQQQVWLPRWFRKLWEGGQEKGGEYREPLAAALVEQAERVPADSDAIRTAVIASRILDRLGEPTPLDDGEQHSGWGAGRLPNGELVFRFNWLLEDLSRSADKVQRPELIRLLKEVGTGEHRSKDPNASRLRLLDHESIIMLRDFARKGGE